jgi:hypothetical protein
MNQFPNVTSHIEDMYDITMIEIELICYGDN